MTKSWQNADPDGFTTTLHLRRYERNGAYISIITRDPTGKLTDARNMMTMPYDALKKMVLEAI